MSKATVVSVRKANRPYGFIGTDAILEHPVMGRILVRDGYGGEGTVKGGCVRWEHGTVNKLIEGDTFESLDAPWNDFMTALEAVSRGHDATRPVLDLIGYKVASIAEAAGI